MGAGDLYFDLMYFWLISLNLLGVIVESVLNMKMPRFQQGEGPSRGLLRDC